MNQELVLRRRYVSRAWNAFKSDRQLRFGIIGIAVLLLLIALAPVIVTHDPTSFKNVRLVAPGEGGHILGTNHLGQDVFSMLIYGIGTSFKVAVISAFISGALGILIGGIAGYIGGKIDTVLSEMINIFLMIPTFFLILLIIALFGNSITNVMIVIGITTWPGNAKLMRAQALSLRERTFVRSAVAMGETNTQILMKYILPNGAFPVIANTTRGMAGAILTEASLSFLGLGDPNVISWGQMIYQGKSFITTAWWVSAFSGLAVIITVIFFYMLGDGLNHVLNPKYNYGRGE